MIGSLKVAHRDHVLFVGFAPADNPQLAIAIILENDDHLKTSENPSLLARTLFDAHLRGRYRPAGEPIYGFPAAKPAVSVAPAADGIVEPDHSETPDEVPEAPVFSD